MRNISDKFVEKIETHILSSVNFCVEIVTFFDII